MSTPQHPRALEIAREFIASVYEGIKDLDWKTHVEGLDFCRKLSREDLSEIAHSPLVAQVAIVEICTSLLSTELMNHVTFRMITGPKPKDQYQIELHIEPKTTDKPASP